MSLHGMNCKVRSQNLIQKEVSNLLKTGQDLAASLHKLRISIERQHQHQCTAHPRPHTSPQIPQTHERTHIPSEIPLLLRTSSSSKPQQSRCMSVLRINVLESGQPRTPRTHVPVQPQLQSVRTTPIPCTVETPPVARPTRLPWLSRMTHLSNQGPKLQSTASAESEGFTDLATSLAALDEAISCLSTGLLHTPKHLPGAASPVPHHPPGIAASRGRVVVQTPHLSGCLGGSRSCATGSSHLTSLNLAHMVSEECIQPSHMLWSGPTLVQRLPLAHSNSVKTLPAPDDGGDTSRGSTTIAQERSRARHDGHERHLQESRHAGVVCPVDGNARKHAYIRKLCAVTDCACACNATLAVPKRTVASRRHRARGSCASEQCTSGQHSVWYEIQYSKTSKHPHSWDK
jgi:hypothetical protein